MSRWHRENPEAYERGWGPPDWRDAADRLRKEERENPGLFACVTCGENVTRYGQRCRTCEEEERLEQGQAADLEIDRLEEEEDRLERESGR